MNIVEHFPPSDGIVAHAEQYGAREGDFRADERGAVSYYHPSDSRVRYAAPSVGVFRMASDAFNEYQRKVRLVDAESEQLVLVDALKRKLHGLGLIDDPESFWSIIAEQASDGLL